jgi:hypothetical protein
MGWHGRFGSKQEAVIDVIREMGDALVDHSVVGNHLWTLFRTEDGRLAIGLDLLKRGGNDWWVKSMDETMGPYYYDCPMRLIRAASPPVSETAATWRKDVEAWHKKKAEERKKTISVKPGDVIQYGSRQFKLTENLGRRGWLITDVDSNKMYRMPVTRLRRIEVVGV